MTQHEFAPEPTLPEAIRPVGLVMIGLGITALAPNQRHELTTSDLIDRDFLQEVANQGLDLNAVMPQDEMTLAQVAHSTVHGQTLAKHKAEFAADKPHADPLPLPKLSVQKMIKSYYENPQIALRGSDKIHNRNLAAVRAQYIPLIEKFREKLPEIQEIINLQQRLNAQGKTAAAGVMSDVLAVYGQVLHGLINRSVKERELRREAERRRDKWS